MSYSLAEGENYLMATLRVLLLILLVEAALVLALMLAFGTSLIEEVF